MPPQNKNIEIIRENLSELEKTVLQSLDENTRRGGEMCVGFDYLADNGLTRKDVQKACHSLKEKGLAEFYRGLMTEDGEVAGSGYCISYEGELLLNPCIDCLERVSDMTDGRCADCWNDRICTKCGKKYKDHELENGYRKEFEFADLLS